MRYDPDQQHLFHMKINDIEYRNTLFRTPHERRRESR